MPRKRNLKIADLSEGDLVEDTWYPDWGIGKVTRLYKTVVYIKFPKDNLITKYDNSHVQFLKIIK